MSQNSYNRQADERGVKLLKAYTHCANSELTLIYVCVGFSFLFCVAGIVLSVLRMDVDITVNKALADSLDLAKTYLSIISGFYIIVQLFLLFFASEFGKNKVTVLEYYDNYVYDLKPNPMITRKISDPQIDDWADHIRKSDEKFKTYYFKGEADEKGIFDNQVRIVHKIYGILNYAMTHFYFLVWSSVLLIILSFAVIIGVQGNVDFAGVILGILIPSLSIIMMIANSFIKYVIQKKAALTCINSIKRLKIKNEQTKTGVNSNEIRNLQDAIFQQRLSLMNIPNFVNNSFEKAYYKKTHRNSPREIKEEKKSVNVKSQPTQTKEPAIVSKPVKGTQTSSKSTTTISKITTKKETPKAKSNPIKAKERTDKKK